MKSRLYAALFLYKKFNAQTAYFFISTLMQFLDKIASSKLLYKNLPQFQPVGGSCIEGSKDEISASRFL